MLFKIVWYFSTSVSFLGKRWKLSSLVLFCLLLLYHALLQPETKHLTRPSIAADRGAYHSKNSVRDFCDFKIPRSF